MSPVVRPKVAQIEESIPELPEPKSGYFSSKNGPSGDKTNESQVRRASGIS